MSQPQLSVLRAACRGLCLIVWLLSVLFFYAAVALFNRRKIESVPVIFHKGCCRIFNFDVKVIGEMDTSRPGLSVGNHLSYLDIFVLGATIPGYFIAKSEVADWPVIGTLAKLQNTLFFERNSRRAKQQIDVMQAHLKEQGRLMLFPEGTSTLGIDVLPFKSSLFKAAELDDGQQVSIQPFAVVHRFSGGVRPDHRLRSYYAWYDDMTFTSHFLTALAAPANQIEVHFFEPVRLLDFADRKACAKHCFEQVQAVVKDAAQAA